MKRNTLRLIKYLTVAAIFLTGGPLFLKFLIGDHHSPQGVVKHPVVVQAHGLPVDPDEMKAVHKEPVSLVS